MCFAILSQHQWCWGQNTSPIQHKHTFLFILTFNPHFICIDFLSHRQTQRERECKRAIAESRKQKAESSGERHTHKRSSARTHAGERESERARERERARGMAREGGRGGENCINENHASEGTHQRARIRCHASDVTHQTDRRCVCLLKFCFSFVCCSSSSSTCWSLRTTSPVHAPIMKQHSTTTAPQSHSHIHTTTATATQPQPHSHAVRQQRCLHVCGGTTWCTTSNGRD